MDQHRVFKMSSLCRPPDILRRGAVAPSQRRKITGVICGVRIEEIEDPLMRKIRCLDKLVDELAKGRPMEKIRRE